MQKAQGIRKGFLGNRTRDVNEKKKKKKKRGHKRRANQESLRKFWGSFEGTPLWWEIMVDSYTNFWPWLGGCLVSKLKSPCGRLYREIPLQNQSWVSVDYTYQRFELTFCAEASPYFRFWGGSSNTLEVRSNFCGKLHGGNFTVLSICLMNIFLRTALQVYFRLLIQAGPVSGWVGWTTVPFQMSSDENKDRMKEAKVYLNTLALLDM